MNEYIDTGRDKDLVDPDPHLLYRRRKERDSKLALESIKIPAKAADRVKFPNKDDAWGKSLDKMPMFTRAQMNTHIKNSGKNIADKDNHTIPTGLRKAKTFLEDQYLEEICCLHDQRYFYFKAKCCHSFRKNEPPHELKIALCVISGDVESSQCSCVAGKLL